jgi:hypothetical protein
MTRIVFAAALALAATLPAMPAQAGANRTFVSAAGNDTNPCTITLPCRNFAAAFMQTNANGQIDALDPGNYGALIITGPVSIQGHGWAGMSAATGNAIIINTAGATDKIAISGVVLDGFGIANTNGIAFDSGGTLIVRDSAIRNFGGSGILVEPNASNVTQLFVSNTVLSDNSNAGIAVFPGGSGTTTGVLSHVETEHNGGDGLSITNAPDSNPTINVTVNDTVSANNGNGGIDAKTSSTVPASVMVRNSTIANNRACGLCAQGTTSSIAVIRVTRSTITGNDMGWVTQMGGVVSSYADNNIDGNTTVNTEPTPALTYR